MNSILRQVTRVAHQLPKGTRYSSTQAAPKNGRVPPEVYPLAVIIGAGLIGATTFTGHKLHDVLQERNVDPTPEFQSPVVGTFAKSNPDVQSLLTMTEEHETISN